MIKKALLTYLDDILSFDSHKSRYDIANAYESAVFVRDELRIVIANDYKKDDTTGKLEITYFPVPPGLQHMGDMEIAIGEEPLRLFSVYCIKSVGFIDTFKRSDYPNGFWFVKDLEHIEGYGYTANLFLGTLRGSGWAAVSSCKGFKKNIWGEFV
jgi:hypothetical protein